MLRGFATINYWTDDMEAAKRGTRSCSASSRTSSTSAPSLRAALPASTLGSIRPAGVPQVRALR